MRVINKIKFSTTAMLLLGNMAFAGGDILPVVEYETVEMIEVAEVVLPVVKEVQAPVVAPELEKKSPKVEKKSLKKVDSPWYMGAGLSMGRVSDAHCEDITYGVVGKIGYDFNEYVGAEARGVRTNWEYEGAKIKHAAVLLKLQYPVSEDINLYGLVGYGKTTTTHKKRVDETGLAYGAGVEYALGEDMNIFVDYERLIDKSNLPALEALSLGVSFDF